MHHFVIKIDVVTVTYKAENPKKITGSKIGAISWQIASRVTTKIWKSGNEGFLS